MNLGFLKNVKVGHVVTVISTAVQSIEVIFGGRVGGRRKRKHAIRRISRELGIAVGSPEASAVLAVVDLLGKFADDTVVLTRAIQAYNAVLVPTAQVLDALAGNPLAFDELADFVADVIDIEAVPNSLEEMAARQIVNFALESIRDSV